MPAEFENGFFVRKPAWHGLGTTLPDYVSREEAFPLSGQDWTVESHRLWDPANSEWVDGYFRAVRSDTRSGLAVHQDSYEVLQNTEGWDLAEAVADQDRAVQFETGITLKGGKVCAILLRDEPFAIGGDDSATVPYTLISWAHDGSAAMTVHATNVRVVCSNTLSLALKGGTQRFSFKHTKNVRDRIEAAKRGISQMRTNTKLYRDLAEYLAKEPVTYGDKTQFARDLIVLPEDATATMKSIVAKKQNKLLHVLSHSRTIPEPLRDTKYALLQGGIEYIDWYGRKARSAEGLFARTYLDSDAAKQRVLDLVV